MIIWEQGLPYGNFSGITAHKLYISKERIMDKYASLNLQSRSKLINQGKQKLSFCLHDLPNRNVLKNGRDEKQNEKQQNI